MAYRIVPRPDRYRFGEKFNLSHEYYDIQVATTENAVVKLAFVSLLSKIT